MKEIQSLMSLKFNQIWVKSTFDERFDSYLTWLDSALLPLLDTSLMKHLMKDWSCSYVTENWWWIYHGVIWMEMGIGFSNLIDIGVCRDAYGFAVRPQHVQRYHEYANIYKVFFYPYVSFIFFFIFFLVPNTNTTCCPLFFENM